jgi:predicted aminopeptidase
LSVGVGLKVVAVLCLWLVVSGCASLAWYGQAVHGQLDLLSRREHIADLLRDPDTDPELARRLEQVLKIRRFAHQELGLPESRSYRHYADIERPAVVWNVIATPRFSLQPRTWCFPIAGCVAYRGYFSRADADAQAHALREQGLDVIVSPAAAYSTLGWFSDPVLSTMLAWDDAGLAGFLFHELSHEQLFVPGDTAFNEAYATLVETVGVERWLDSQGNPAALQAWRDRLELRQRWTAVMLDARDRLADGYHRLRGDEAALAAFKAEAFGDLSEALAELAEASQSDWIRRWAERGLNNADLALVASYREGVSAFEAVLQGCDQDLDCFHARVAEIAGQGPSARADFLHQKERG